jgi:DoxX-like family
MIKKMKSNQLKYILNIIEIGSALVVSCAMLMYGVGKIIQFPDTIQHTKQVAELSGQELMWAFYGYSKSFPFILGLLEILGGMLLLIKQTRLLACLLLSTILVNVILQDIIYNINQGALIAAIIYQILIVVLLIINKEKVVQIFKLFIETKKTETSDGFKKTVLKVIYIGLFFLFIKVIEYYLTHSFNIDSLQ